MRTEMPGCLVAWGESLAAYGFPDGHQFGADRHDAFLRELEGSPAWGRVQRLWPIAASEEQLGWFHTPAHIERVRQQSLTGEGYLDAGDTPAFRGVFEAASVVAGTALAALDAICTGQIRRAFVPIGGLHHAARDQAAGFCVFNDCGIVVEAARRVHGLQRVAYVDIDAHHGDGVFYAFEDDPELIFVDIHEDGRFLYPGTGSAEETGRGPAVGTKLNLPAPPAMDDELFADLWRQAERFIIEREPELIILQCGADSLEGDPITHLRLSENAHAHVAARLRAVAGQFAAGRMLALGGGGYNRRNLARAWTRVVEALV